MILKVSSSWPARDLFYKGSHGEYSMTTWWMNDRNQERLVPGKITLSIKKGKRRRLISGMLRTEDDDAAGYRYIHFLFKPNNPDKMRALIGD